MYVRRSISGDLPIPKNTEAPFSREKAEYWMAVDQYVGGGTCHTSFAVRRFFTKFLYDLGLSPVDEPFTNLLTQEWF